MKSHEASPTETPGVSSSYSLPSLARHLPYMLYPYIVQQSQTNRQVPPTPGPPEQTKEHEREVNKPPLLAFAFALLVRPNTNEPDRKENKKTGPILLLCKAMHVPRRLVKSVSHSRSIERSRPSEGERRRR